MKQEIPLRNEKETRTEEEEREIRMIQKKLLKEHPHASAHSLYQKAEALYFKDSVKVPLALSEKNPYQGFGFDFKTFWKAALGAFFVFFFFFILFFVLWLLFHQ